MNYNINDELNANQISECHFKQAEISKQQIVTYIELNFKKKQKTSYSVKDAPHLSLCQLAYIAELLKVGKHVRKWFL